MQLKLSEHQVPAVSHCCSHEVEVGHGKGTVLYDSANDCTSNSLALSHLLCYTCIFLQLCTQMHRHMWHMRGTGAPAQVLTGMCTPLSVLWTGNEQSSSLITVISAP